MSTVAPGVWFLQWDFWVSFFTLALCAITGVLAWETRKLRKDGAESIAAAKQSADAAQKSSEAALNSARIAEETMRRTSDDLKATALLELYATYSNPHYTGIRKNAWNLIILCTRSKKYFDFFISTYFVTEYRIDGMPNEIAKELIEHANLVHSKRFGTVEELKNWELQARHDFEEVMNFYNLVNHRIKSTAFQARYEFYYDWWRPFFWWVSDELNCYYKRMSEQRRRLVSPPKWQAIWESLDQIYGFETADTPNDRWIAFQTYPVVASLGLDENHTSPTACT